MPTEERTNDESLIHELLTKQTRAIRDKDASAAVAVFTEDAVGFDLDPPLRHGPAEMRDKGRIQAWFDTWRGPIECQTRDLRIELGSDVGFAYSLQRMVGTKTDGAKADLWFRSSVCLRKERGAWKIAHTHQSVPFEMDGSNLAALDLEP